MCIEQSATFDGITVKSEGWYLAFIGPKASLIAAGIATEPMFPVGKQKRRSSRLSNFQPGDPDDYFCCSLLPSGLYRVTLISPDFAHKFRSTDATEQQYPDAPLINLEAQRRNRPRHIYDRPAVVLVFPSGGIFSQSVFQQH